MLTRNEVEELLNDAGLLVSRVIPAAGSPDEQAYIKARRDDLQKANLQLLSALQDKKALEAELAQLRAARPTLEQVLARMYASEINVQISCFWDAGWDVWLGDKLNGWKAKVSVDTPDQIGPALHALIIEHFPDSAYARQAAIDGGLQVPICDTCGRDDLQGIVNGRPCWRCGQLWLEANLEKSHANPA